ncbi:hypothetical protein LSM04_001584 [Trypanosoma melophagium]|uniref:uncharacterized protein n=1 Tax=Trypanosoma melophagium TaxID=715481 RepID=UPI00351A4F13|nr:hypothetical protein LSM04_001584 [Trypanosoma melophagium]
MNTGSFNSINQKYVSVCVGSTLRRLVPRFVDDCPDVRVEASKGIVACILVDIISLELLKKDVEECTETILDLGKRAYVFKSDTTLSAEKEAISIIKNLCSTLVEELHQSENIISLIRTLLFVEVFDSQRYASVGACVVMHGLIHGHGEMLDTAAVREIFDGLIEALKVDSLAEEVRNGVLTSLCNLTRHHILPCFGALLRSPVPHSKAVINTVESIAYDLSVCEMLVKRILDTVLNSPITEASPASNNKQNNVRVASSKVLSSVCAAGWIAQTERGASVYRILRASLYMAIVLHITVCHSICDENAVMESGKALEHVTNSTVDDITMVRFDRYGWVNFLIRGNYLSAIGEAVCYWSRDELGDSNEMDRAKIADVKGRFASEPSVPSPLVYELARFMLFYCGHVSETYRKTAVCVCGELITFALRDEELIRALLMALLSRTGTDEEPLTREIVLGNMVNILKHPYTEVSSFVLSTISAIIGCMEPRHPFLATKAISVITILAEGLEDKFFIDTFIVTIVTKLRSLFEHQDADSRIMAFDCLRRLYILANHGMLKKDCVSQHVYPYVIPLLVHLAEKENSVCNSVKSALRELLKFITSLHLEAGKKIKQILSKPHMLVSHERNVRELYDDPDPPEELSRCVVERVSASLVELVGVSEKSETVQIAAAVAIGSFSGI